jgi:TrmH family RNA methyltransferase
MHMTKNEIKFVKSLTRKKHRKDTGLFLVEGAKIFLELALSNYEIKNIFVTDEFYTAHKGTLSRYANILQFATSDELTNAGNLEFNDTVIAVAGVKNASNADYAQFIKNNADGITVLLDGVRDPGNLGTIIRTAEWYGVKNIVCSMDSADVYNSKTIAASMGSFMRVNIEYTDLENFLITNKNQNNITVYGAMMDGVDAHTTNFPQNMFLLMGSEANGVRPDVLPYMNKHITIPRFGNAESLNVSIATAVILDNISRQNNV